MVYSIYNKFGEIVVRLCLKLVLELAAAAQLRGSCRSSYHGARALGSRVSRVPRPWTLDPGGGVKSLVEGLRDCSDGELWGHLTLFKT